MRSAFSFCRLRAEELERRLRSRSEADDEIQRKLQGENARRFNTEETIQRRLQTASREIENFCDYDYILVNDRVDQAIDTLKSIVRAERLRRSGALPAPEDDAALAQADAARRPRMMDQVQSILATFELSRAFDSHRVSLASFARVSRSDF